MQKFIRTDLAEFKRITSNDMEALFRRAVAFFNSSYQSIVSYYGGEFSKANQSDFTLLEDLEKEVEKTLLAYRSNGKRLKNVRWWELLEQVEEIGYRLKALKKMYKWTKSSVSSFGYNPAFQAPYTLKKGQTLERVSRDLLSDSNPDAWVELALQNQLKEEDYTSEGGVELTLTIPVISRGVNINSVVDSMVGKNIYGKDLDKALQFDTQAEDLKCLTPEATVKQSVEILSRLRKNDNPDFPEHGLQTGVIIGGSRASLNFPVIQRQYTETFATDDSLKNFQITEIRVEEDSLKIDFTVQTRLDETESGTIEI